MMFAVKKLKVIPMGRGAGQNAVACGRKYDPELVRMNLTPFLFCAVTGAFCSYPQQSRPPNSHVAPLILLVRFLVVTVHGL